MAQWKKKNNNSDLLMMQEKLEKCIYDVMLRKIRKRAPSGANIKKKLFVQLKPFVSYKNKNIII